MWSNARRKCPRCSGKAMDKKGVKRALGVIGCAFCWLIAVLLALLEGIFLYLWIDGTRYIMEWGAEENPYAAEDAWVAGVFASMTALPLILMLVAAICSTIKLRKRGKKREHPAPDKR